MSDAKANWTILTYIAAHNDLEDYGLGRRSLDKILSAGSSSALQLVALYDRYDGATRIIVGGPGQTRLEERLGDFDSGDPDGLLETARWAFERCPAEHYALVLWSHGSGWRPEEVERRRLGGERGERSGQATFSWRPEEIQKVARQARGDDKVAASETNERAGRPGGSVLFRTTLARILQRDRRERAICFDDGSGHSLDTLELERVTGGVQEITGQPLDLLGMDACTMASLEVAYQVRRHVRYLVASEELVPGLSWPYDTILGELHGNPTTSPHDLATRVVAHYTDYYTTHRPRINYGDVTKVALDLSRADELAEAVDGLAEALLADIDAQAEHLWHAQRQTEEIESLGGKRRRDSSKFGWHLWDLGTLAAHLAAHSENKAVQAAARAVGRALKPGGTVIDEQHLGEWFNGIGGLSIYLVPPSIQRISPFYAQVALAQDTRWGEMLEAYHRVLA